ncbi:hypothetical protein BDZ89DRAFT_1147122 [Hymenopellis radicata]|nr:hypothetical protein BDZ89DRAFT_1147122 [Hymenopellis radicata]
MTSLQKLDYTTESSLTPFSYTRSTGLSRTMNAETAATVREDVDADFAKQCRVAQTKDFMQKLFPVPDNIIEEVYRTVQINLDYDGKRWKDFPPENTVVKEKALYAPFVNAANAIRTATEAAQAEENHELRDVAEWVDYHSQTPQSSDPDAAAIRPDCLLAHNVSKFKEVASANERKQTAEKDKEAQRKEKLEASVWWLQIICAVEMKRKDSQSQRDVVKQLIGYLRRILREQLDRRFVFGLTLGPNRMTVWLHDRSGVLGTTTSFNIHEDPRSFIRVIAAFSVLSMEQLGYDTQMKFYASPTSIVPTYRLDDEAVPSYLSATREKQWVITTNDNEQYLTVKVLSIARAYIMQGRASLVWAVVPFKDGQVTSKKLLVLKQSWRPVGTDSEYEMLSRVKNAAAAAKDTPEEGEDFIGQVQLEETISMRGEADITGSLIRGDLQIAVFTTTPSSAGSKRTRDEAIEGYLHVNATDDDIISIVTSAGSSPPISRIHTRLLLSTFGWPLKYFKTRREAVCGIRDAIGGHGYVYFNGLLHRDISPGNIILAWCDGESENKTDALENFPALDSGAAERKASIFHEVAGEKDMMQTTIDGSAMVAGSAVVARFISMHMLSTPGNMSPGSPLPVLVLLLIPLFCDGLRFTSAERQSGSRTGTPPYTSGEILSRERYYPSPDLFHDAVHDIESFFWVLIHICLTRSGPNAQRRAELDDSKDHPQLHLVVYCFFDGDQDLLAFNKKKLLKTPDDFEKYIIPHFHPYFDELKPFMQEWFSLLVLAYQYVEGYEYHNIHRRVQDILDRALVSMTPEERDSDAGRKAVIGSRHDLLDEFKLMETLTDAGGDTGIVKSFDRTSPSAQRPGNAKQYTDPPNSGSFSPPPSPSPMPPRSRNRDGCSR